MGDIDSLLQEWREEVDDLDRRAEQIEENQGSYYKGSWDAAFERAEPSIKQSTLERCSEELENCSCIEEFLEVMADWRKDIEEKDKRIYDTKKAFRYRYIRYQLQECVDDLDTVLPDDEFASCKHCDERKMPYSDKKYNKGFRWECPECGF